MRNEMLSTNLWLFSCFLQGFSFGSLWPLTPSIKSSELQSCVRSFIWVPGVSHYITTAPTPPIHDKMATRMGSSSQGRSSLETPSSRRSSNSNSTIWSGRAGCLVEYSTLDLLLDVVVSTSRTVVWCRHRNLDWLLQVRIGLNFISSADETNWSEAGNPDINRTGFKVEINIELSTVLTHVENKL